MLFDISYLEWIGYAASALVAISLTMSSIMQLRWYNMIGAAIFSFYGFAIGSLPVGLLNLFIVFTNIYYLSKIYTRKEAFKLITTNLNDSYLKYYLDFNRTEISHFFPAFEKKISEKIEETSDLMILLLLRDAKVAGVFIGSKTDKDLHVIVDYVSAPYRDMKAGNFIYNKNIRRFEEQEIERMICETKHPKYKKYLEKMGFNAFLFIGENEVFVKYI